MRAARLAGKGRFWVGSAADGRNIRDKCQGSPNRLSWPAAVWARTVRLRPRRELGESQKMAEFKVEDLYDLSSIPDDAIREFELYLKCSNEGPRAQIARFIHDKYLGK